MNTLIRKSSLANLLALLLLPAGHAIAYNSGSTGADGAFNPVVDTEIVLPPDGIFNYTTVNIPAGVTVTFKKNQVNTPVTWLATGDVTIDGKVILSGTSSPDVGAAGDGAVGDDGLPGLAGPGGFDGGVVIFGDGLDPADMVKSGAVEELATMFRNTKTFIEFVLDEVLSLYDLRDQMAKASCMGE